MAVNEFGAELDRNGYAPSILQLGDCCFRCGRQSEKLDRHEVWGGPFRDKSKRLGLWVRLCHQSCHLDGVHQDAEYARRLRRYAQGVAMEEYGWSTEDFIREFGKNYR